MKKFLFIGAILITIIYLIFKEENIIIPENSIRFRVIANSNSNSDIEMKEKVVNHISTSLNDIFETDSIEASRKNINTNINKINNIINRLFEEENYNKDFLVNYGINYFPSKTYKGVEYNEGYYESLVVTIGNGDGNNYWCVMFPPLCMIEEDTSVEDYEYKFKIVEILKKFSIIN